MGIKIKKTSSYLPERIVDNFYFEKILDTSDEWISSRTGIKKRHFVEDEGIFDLVQESIKRLNLSEEEKESIKTIIVATCTSSYEIPNLASQIQKSFGLAEDVYSLDINMACSGFVAGLKLIDGIIEDGENALLVGVELFSDIIDFEDRNTAILFGDGAGAVLLEKGEEESHFTSGTCGNRKALNYGGEPSKLHMEGREVYKFAVSTMERETKEFLKKIGKKKEDIDYFVAHQANIRILESLGKSLGVPMHKIPSNIEEVGNTSSASIPLLLDSMNRKGSLKKGDRIVFLAFGAGLTWSLAYIKWGGQDEIR